MKVLFIDIDGVFNHFNDIDPTPFRQSEDGHSLQTDPEKVFLLNNFVDLNPEIKVVLSSTWRLNKLWREEMRANGFLFDFLDRTPYDRGDNPHEVRRGCEIDQWMGEWNKAHPEACVERYAILDDDTDFLPSQLPSFFRTLATTGLTKEIMEKVSKHLNGV